MKDRINEDCTFENNGYAAIYFNNQGKAYACWYAVSDVKPKAVGFTMDMDTHEITPHFSWADKEHEGIDKETGCVIGTYPKVGGDGSTMA